MVSKSLLRNDKLENLNNDVFIGMEKKLVTLPFRLDVLIKFLVRLDYDFTSYELDGLPSLMLKLKYIGITEKLSNSEFDVFDFINAFINENKDKLVNKVEDIDSYVVPEKKDYVVYGSEIYNARKEDNYELDVSGIFSGEEYVRRLINDGEYNIYDGRFIDGEIHDAWDTEHEIFSIKIKENISRIKEIINNLK